MIYILAAIGAITVAVLLWQAFGPARETVEHGPDQRPTVAPDDDPDFLRRLDERKRKPRDNEG